MARQGFLYLLLTIICISQAVLLLNTLTRYIDLYFALYEVYDVHCTMYIIIIIFLKATYIRRIM